MAVRFSRAAFKAACEVEVHGRLLGCILIDCDPLVLWKSFRIYDEELSNRSDCRRRCRPGSDSRGQAGTGGAGAEEISAVRICRLRLGFGLLLSSWTDDARKRTG